jgi:arylsulfatase A-like enzyme
LDGKPAFDVRVDGVVSRIVSESDAPDEFVFEAKLMRESISLSINGEKVAEGASPGLIPIQPKDGMNTSFDDLSAAGNYESPNRLQGTVSNLEVVAGERVREGAERLSPHAGVEIQPAAFGRMEEDAPYQVRPLPERMPFQVLRNSENNVLALANARLVKNILQPPTNGIAIVDDGCLSYAPNEGYVGNDSITVLCERSEVVQVKIDVREHPNFVFILTDDQGWTSMSVSMDAAHPEYASDYHKTPHIDSLASEGMRFSRGYSPAPNCSPSRYANLTGKTCARLHFTDIVGRNNTLRPLGSFLLRPVAKATQCIQEDEDTIPELLHTIPDAEYATAHFGKWHLGGNGPASHGFDVSDGPTGNREGSQGSTVNDDPKRAFSITQRACDFLTETSESDRPFYCQVSHYAVHASIQHRAFTLQEQESREPGERHSDPAYAAMIADLDEAVGLLLDEIDRLGLRNSTYLVYQADNGCPQFLSTSAPLRRFKPETWDGGTRVPTFVRGPGVKAGSQCDDVMMGIDILPTIWDWADGAPAQLPTDIDGGSLAPTITAISTGSDPVEVERPGEVVAHSPHYILTPDLMKNQRPASVLHSGPWKLTAWYETGELLLFNLTDEISESTDVATQYPVEYAQLRVRLRDYLKSVDAQMPTLDSQSFGLPAETNDVDQDGLPDVWELRELLTWKSGPDDDPDGDNRSNLVEFQQGTDPIVAD